MSTADEDDDGDDEGRVVADEMDSSAEISGWVFCFLLDDMIVRCVIVRCIDLDNMMLFRF